MPRSRDLDTVAPDDPVVKPANPPQNTPNITNTPPTSPVVDSVYRILGHAKSPLSSLLVHPHVFDFSERDDDETVLVVARQHWFTNVRWILISIFVAVLPSFSHPVISLLNIPLNYQFVGNLFWYLVTFAYAFENFLSWYFNVYIITTKRVIDIDFNNLLTKKYSEAGIAQVQDVTSSVIGAIPTIFNYGNILIQTAAEVNELTFERVANPEKIIKVLQELRDHLVGGEK
jgi:hypothetical protein